MSNNEVAVQPNEDGVVVLDHAILGATGFATKVSTIAFENDYSFSDIFNGLNIATAAFLMDFSSTEEGINDATMEAATERYIDGLRRAVEFGLQGAKNMKPLIELAE